MSRIFSMRHRRDIVLPRVIRGHESDRGLVRKAGPITATEDVPDRHRELYELKKRVEDLEARFGLFEKRIQQHKRGMGYSGLQAFVNTKACIACGTCQESCPKGAIFVGQVAHIDPARCAGCGYCVEWCPQGAIHMGRT
jgi:Pyruvate/2-oxoacid:ferredoxin oxidoreductase delta subunit